MVVPKSVEQPDLFSPLCGTKHPKCGFIRQQWSCLILYFTSNNDSKNENNIIDHAIEVASDWLGSWVDLLSGPMRTQAGWRRLKLHRTTRAIASSSQNLWLPDVLRKKRHEHTIFRSTGRSWDISLSHPVDLLQFAACDCEQGGILDTMNLAGSNSVLKRQ